MAKYIGSYPLTPLKYWTLRYWYPHLKGSHYWENNPITGSPYLYETREEAEQYMREVKLTSEWLEKKARGAMIEVIDVYIKPGDLEDDNIFID